MAKGTGHYNVERLHSAIGYITPKDKLEERAQAIFAERDRHPQEARKRRAEAREREQKSAQHAAASCEAVAVPA